MRKNHDARLRRLETGGGPAHLRDWPSPIRLCERLARWIATGTAPDDVNVRMQLVGTADACLRGLPVDSHLVPRTCSASTLLELFQKGGSAQFTYLNQPLPPERPDPLPRAWRQFARDVDALQASLPKPDLGHVDAADWRYA